jgi:hypothetical protein
MKNWQEAIDFIEEDLNAVGMLLVEDIELRLATEPTDRGPVRQALQGNSDPSQRPYISERLG